MKKILSICICALMAVMMLAACGPKSGVSGGASSDVAPSEGTNVGDGVYEGKIGTVLKTYFFDFKVLSAEAVDTYADTSPEEGNRFIVVEIETTNTFGSKLEMYYTDYQLQWGTRGADDDDFAITLDALNDEGAPRAHDLADGETMKFYYVYEAPVDVNEFELCYLEEFDDDSTGEIYFAKFKV